jgi:hypothetical protein
VLMFLASHDRSVIFAKYRSRLIYAFVNRYSVV